MKRKRPDVEIVGDDLHPIGQVKDFAPYVAKIKASGADTVLTGSSPIAFDTLLKTANDVGGDIQAVTASLRKSRTDITAKRLDQPEFGAGFDHLFVHVHRLLGGDLFGAGQTTGLDHVPAIEQARSEPGLFPWLLAKRRD